MLSLFSIFRNNGKYEKDDGGQGYGYQVWMGRHNSWRAIGGQNQLIMVIPEYDLVVASNGQIGDEAGFNQLIYNLLDGMSDKKLKPNKNFDLRAGARGPGRTNWEHTISPCSTTAARSVSLSISPPTAMNSRLQSWLPNPDVSRAIPPLHRRHATSP